VGTVTQVSLAGLLTYLLTLVAWSEDLPFQNSNVLDQQSAKTSQVITPNRPSAPLYTGEQGKQRSEIEFTPSSRTVTIKLQVEDPNGYFLPNIRPDNFAVYEDGARQKNITVEVEHSRVAVALLMEFGGRYHTLNETVGRAVREVGRDLLDVIGSDDQVAVLKYGERLETVVDFNQGRDAVDRALGQLGTPGVSELNLFDALLETLNRMRGVVGRKAIILVSSGLDTFSQTPYPKVLGAARDFATPIYTFGLAPLLRLEAAAYGSTAPFARVDWNEGEKQLETLAKISGGRAYLLESDIGIAAIYDDIMENLRMRYVITYVSSNKATSGAPRKIRVKLIDPKTGLALRIRDSNGRPVSARAYVQESYSPNPS
jgi:Ca-activated chloride channel homolog